MRRRQVELPKPWSRYVKSALLNAIALASFTMSYTRGRATTLQRLRAELDQAKAEVEMLREEMSIKDGRWDRADTRRKPHYLPTERMRILILRAARGWTNDITARKFHIDAQTLLGWMGRIDETCERPLIRTIEPINRFPDFVRVLVRQLKTLFPAMGHVRIAQTLARAGLRLSATTVRRIVREKAGPKLGEPVAVVIPRRRRVAARYPGHTWHLDLTAVPTRAGFWIPWFPHSAPQRWPFCWCVAVVVDQVSRTMLGFAVFARTPDSRQLQEFLERVIQSVAHTPRHIITDRGSQFWCRAYRRWCKRRGIRPRFGRLGEPSSICICERFIRSRKDECTRRLIGPLFHSAVRREIGSYATWYNESRPHTHLFGRTPHEVFHGRRIHSNRFETRPRMPGYRAERADRLELVVSYRDGRRHLPVIQLRRAAQPTDSNISGELNSGRGVRVMPQEAR